MFQNVNQNKKMYELKVINTKYMGIYQLEVHRIGNFHTDIVSQYYIYTFPMRRYSPPLSSQDTF